MNISLLLALILFLFAPVYILISILFYNLALLGILNIPFNNDNDRYFWLLFWPILFPIYIFFNNN